MVIMLIGFLLFNLGFSFILNCNNEYICKNPCMAQIFTYKA